MSGVTQISAQRDPPRVTSLMLGGSNIECVATYLYRCFSERHQLLYVGIAEDWERRLRQHAADKPWWPDVDHVTTMAFESREAALWAEWAVISTCHPTYNRIMWLPEAPAEAPPPSPPLVGATSTLFASPEGFKAAQRPPPASRAEVPADVRAKALMIARDAIWAGLPDYTPPSVVQELLANEAIWLPYSDLLCLLGDAMEPPGATPKTEATAAVR